MYYNFSCDQYICYEIEEGIVKVTSYNEPGGNRTVSIGSVGSVRNPKGELVTETSAYGRVRFDIKSVLNQDNLITQLSQQILSSKACINLACDAIHSVTLLFSTDVISAESVDICSTNRAIRLCSALVKSMFWISSQYMKNSSP